MISAKYFSLLILHLEDYSSKVAYPAPLENCLRDSALCSLAGVGSTFIGMRFCFTSSGHLFFPKQLVLATFVIYLWFYCHISGFFFILLVCIKCFFLYIYNHYIESHTKLYSDEDEEHAFFFFFFSFLFKVFFISLRLRFILFVTHKAPAQKSQYLKTKISMRLQPLHSQDSRIVATICTKLSPKYSRNKGNLFGAKYR